MSQKSSTCYDDFGETFGKSRKDLHWPEIDIVLEKFLTELKPTTGMLADVGCGNGRFLKHITEHDKSEIYKSIFSTFVGLDSSPVLLDQARDDASLNSFFPSINWREGDMRNLGKELTEFGSFDGIFFTASFHHLANYHERLSVLRQAKKLLSLHGKICMINWNLMDPSQEKYKNSQIQQYPDGSADYEIKIGKHLRFYHSFSPQEYHSLIQEVGLKVLHESFGERNSTLILQ